VRVFLDANVLFSAARADGAVRELLHLLQIHGHALIADDYVVAEASRNLISKEGELASANLRTLLRVVEVAHVRVHEELAAAQWLPVKDRPVLLAAIALECVVLVTEDRTHFGPGYSRTFGGVLVCSPALLARMIPDAG
jgi:predicted nucleic acid-binding protein